MTNTSVAEKPVMVQAVFDMTKPDIIRPDMLGELDAAEGLPFAPEMYYVKHSDLCLYAAGWVTVKGPSYLTDGFLLGSEVASIEDDYQFIREGGA